MKRVIKPGGYLFLTFPCMSWLRRKRAEQGSYMHWLENEKLLEGFYQFALPVNRVESEFCSLGLDLVCSRSISGLKGFKDEIDYKPLKGLLQQLYDSQCLVGKAAAWGLDRVLAPFAGHCQLMIFKCRK